MAVSDLIDYSIIFIVIIFDMCVLGIKMKAKVRFIKTLITVANIWYLVWLIYLSDGSVWSYWLQYTLINWSVRPSILIQCQGQIYKNINQSYKYLVSHLVNLL